MVSYFKMLAHFCLKTYEKLNGIIGKLKQIPSPKTDRFYEKKTIGFHIVPMVSLAWPHLFERSLTHSTCYNTF